MRTPGIGLEFAHLIRVLQSGVLQGELRIAKVEFNLPLSIAPYYVAVSETSRPYQSLDVDHFEACLVGVIGDAGYITFLTAGGAENRQALIKAGTTAVEAAGAIHTDIQKGFIRAGIISFADMIAGGGETQAKRANKQRLETKTYVMQDCDVTNPRFNKS